MDRVSRPLLGLLVATVLVFALWIVALKPSSSSNNPNGTGSSQVNQFQSDIAAAHKAVSTANNASAAAGGTATGSASASSATTKASTTKASTTGTSTTKASITKASTTTTGSSSTKPATTHRSAKHNQNAPASVLPRSQTSAQRLSIVTRALERHKVLALLFFNPAGADDRAVKKELESVPARHGNVVKLAVPIAELAQYTVVTTQVPVSQSPTLVLIDRAQGATTLVGFADSFTIDQRVDDAFAVKAAARAS